MAEEGDGPERGPKVAWFANIGNQNDGGLLPFHIEGMSEDNRDRV